MSSIIAAGASLAVTIPAGQVLSGTGLGVAVIGPGPGANQQIGLDADGCGVGRSLQAVDRFIEGLRS